MRILQLRLASANGAPDRIVDFHPYVSVVRGLGDERRVVLDALRALPGGADPGLAGLVEAHGVLFDLDVSTLAMLDLSHDVDAVVTASDLPGAGVSPAQREVRRVRTAAELVGERLEGIEEDLASRVGARDAARDAVTDAEAALESARRDEGHTVEALEAAREALRAAEAGRDAADAATGAAADREGARDEAVQAARARVGELQEQRMAAVRECTRIAASVEELRSALDVSVDERIEQAATRLVELTTEREREAEAAQNAARLVAAGELEPPEVRVERLTERLDTLRTAVFAAEATDPTAVADALALHASLDTVEQVPDDEAEALADEMADLHAQVTAASPEGSDSDALARARERIELAQAELHEAEEAVRLPELDREDIDRLEEAHAVVLEAQERADGRFGGARAIKRLEDAREAEAGVLERLGFATYSDYMMGTSILHVDAVTELRLDNARRDLTEAEASYAAMQAGVEDELRMAEVHERMRACRDRAGEILRRDVADVDELIAALRGRTVPVVSEDEVLERLRTTLLQAGLAVDGVDLTADELIGLAESFVAEHEVVAVERERIAAESAAASHELDVARAELAVVEGEDDPEQRWERLIGDAEAQVAAAREAQVRRDEQETRIEAAFAELDAATRAETEAAAGLDAAEAELREIERPAGDDESAPVTDLAEASRLVAERMVAVEEIEAGLGERLRAAEANAEAATGRLREADAAVEEQTARRDKASAELAALESERAAAEASVAAEGDSGARTVEPEEIEWYLLSRLAAQRALSFAGSVPLVIDDALVDVEQESVPPLLDRLERMSAAVQVVVISDAEGISRWAEAAGPQRAAVVTPAAEDDPA